MRAALTARAPCPAVIGLPSIAPTHQTWKWVWTKWYSQEENPVGALAHTGLPSNGWMFCAGMLMAQFLVLCYDVPSHMAEETHNASWTVPRSIAGSFVCAGFLNLCLLLSYLFSVQHLGNLGWGVTQGLYPIGNLFWDVFAARFPDTAIASGATGGPGSGPYEYSSTSSDGDCLLKSGATCLNVMTNLPNPTAAGRNGSSASLVMDISPLLIGSYNYARATSLFHLHHLLRRIHLRHDELLRRQPFPVRAGARRRPAVLGLFAQGC